MAKSLMVSLFWELYTLNEQYDKILCSGDEIATVYFLAQREFLQEFIVEHGLWSEFENFCNSPVYYEIIYNRERKVPWLRKS